MARRPIIRPEVGAATQFKPGHKGHKKKRVYSTWETQQQLRAVEGLLIKQASPSQIVRLMRAYEVPCGEARTKNLISRIHAQWIADGEAERATTRVVQIKRLIEVIEHAKHLNDKGEWVDPDYTAMLKAESLLADLQGTREVQAAKVEVRVQHSLLNVIANLTPQEIERIQAQQEQLELAAENAH